MTRLKNVPEGAGFRKNLILQELKKARTSGNIVHRGSENFNS